MTLLNSIRSPAFLPENMIQKGYAESGSAVAHGIKVILDGKTSKWMEMHEAGKKNLFPDGRPIIPFKQYLGVELPEYEALWRRHLNPIRASLRGQAPLPQPTPTPSPASQQPSGEIIVPTSKEIAYFGQQMKRRDLLTHGAKQLIGQLYS